jgi:hypothetical protein
VTIISALIDQPYYRRHGWNGSTNLVHFVSREAWAEGFAILNAGAVPAWGSQAVENIYAQIEEELRNQYSLGYTPDKGIDPGYHKIHLLAKQKDLLVQARDGYYSGQ